MRKTTQRIIKKFKLIVFVSPLTCRPAKRCVSPFASVFSFFLSLACSFIEMRKKCEMKLFANCSKTNSWSISVSVWRIQHVNDFNREESVLYTRYRETCSRPAASKQIVADSSSIYPTQYIIFLRIFQ